MILRRIADDLYAWTDTCNVYVLKDGTSALLIDLGDGGVLDHLSEIGVADVEWVLFTHHHREQCQGASRLDGRATKRACPEAERAFFERPTDFRRMRPGLDDPHTVYGASYLRPPVLPVRMDRGLARTGTFSWRGREIWCLETAGNSPGSLSYLLRHGERFIAFTGDVMLDGARMHNWFDTEWDYGYGRGIVVLHNAVASLERFDPSLLLPSHGPIIADPSRQMKEYRRKLRDLHRIYLRGYDLATFAEADQDFVSVPSPVPHVWSITPHLHKLKGPDFWPNFALLLADSGRALAIDCGCLDRDRLDRALEGMKERLGLEGIDAAIITHMHGDHCESAPYLREAWGAAIWTLDRVAGPIEHPERYDLAAALNAYRLPFESIAFDRILRDGETFEWEDFTLTADWMPGQTEYGMCLHGSIDGRRVAFTGDNLFANPDDPAQNGHEAVVARNSAVLEEGYLYAANYLHGLDPDLIVAGHGWVMENPRALIERFRRSTLDLRNSFTALSVDPDYRHGFDPYRVKAFPYRSRVRRGETVEVAISVRNYRDRDQGHRIAMNAPPGISCEPTILEGFVGPDRSETYPLTIEIDAEAAAGVAIVAFDVAIDGERHGEWFDCIVEVSE